MGLILSVLRLQLKSLDMLKNFQVFIFGREDMSLPVHTYKALAYLKPLNRIGGSVVCMLVNPTDRYPLVVGGQRMQGVHDLRVTRICVIVGNDEINILFVLSLNTGALLQGLLHIFFLFDNIYQYKLLSLLFLYMESLLITFQKQ